MQGNISLKQVRNSVLPELVMPYISRVFFFFSNLMKNCLKKASINCLCPDYSIRSLTSSSFFSSISSSKYSLSNSTSFLFWSLDSVSIIQSFRALSNTFSLFRTLCLASWHSCCLSNYLKSWSVLIWPFLNLFSISRRSNLG